MRRALVTGAGGMIGNYMVSFLKAKGYWVRGVDSKHKPDYAESAADEYQQLDLRDYHEARHAFDGQTGFDEVYHFAADMGGIWTITKRHASISRNNVLINTNMLEAARIADVDHFFFSSSACVYRQDRQREPDLVPLREEDAWPADPEDGYGLEKLFTEKLCAYYTEEYKLKTHVARFHNIMGPGEFEGGREKAPAALCRKVILAKDGDEVEIWGDGKQTRSFLHVSDCAEGIFRIVQRDIREPINLGSDQMVSILELFQLITKISGKTLHARFNMNQPQGVRGRNSNNNLMRAYLGWEPALTLEEGLKQVYSWIKNQLQVQGRLSYD